MLDVDWFVESHGCSTLGRGLDISVRGAMLPVHCQSPFSADVTLHVALPARPRMFKARGVAVPRKGHGWAIRFTQVDPEDLRLLADELVDQHGLAALPALARKFARDLRIPVSAFRESL